MVPIQNGPRKKTKFLDDNSDAIFEVLIYKDADLAGGRLN